MKIIEANIKNGFFYTITQIYDYFSLWVIDSIPEDMERETIEKFCLEHETEGTSISGSYEDIIKELSEM